VSDFHMLSAFLHGYLLSFGLILPLGPQNVFVFSQGATQPKLRRALPVVLTAALADTMLILIAVLGVSAVVLTVPWVKIVLGVFGVCFLLYIGWVTWRSEVHEDDATKLAHDWPVRRNHLRTGNVALNPRDPGLSVMDEFAGLPRRKRRVLAAILNYCVVLHAGDSRETDRFSRAGPQVAQSRVGGHHLDQRGVSGVQSDACCVTCPTGRRRADA
jgi:hypothetical protein